MEEALEEAVRNGDLQRVQGLVRRGADVNARCEEGSLLILAILNGHQEVALELLSAGVDVHTPDVIGQSALQQACAMNMEAVAQALIDGGSPVDEQYGFCSMPTLMSSPFRLIPALSVKPRLKSASEGRCTALMVAACEGREKIVKRLILAGAMVGLQNENGDTALHMAARENKIQCGIALAEGGASVRIKNDLLQTPLDIASEDFKEAIKQSLAFSTRKTLCVIGNAESGKSTLVAALQAESKSFLGRIFNHLRRVNDRRKRTTGIEMVSHCSQNYGEVLFYDFAGQHDYHGPHQMFLEAILCNPGVSVTLLLVVNATKDEEAILHEFHRWLSPVALLASAASPAQVIVVGSFLDKVKLMQEVNAKLTRCIEATKKDLEGMPLEFVGSCLLNCRQPQSSGINQLNRLLQGVPIPEFRATRTQYSLAWVLAQIRSFFTSQAVQLQDFSAWIQSNKENLPQHMPSPEEVCQDLTAAGHALYLSKKEDPSMSWLVLDLPGILHDVYGTLFSQAKEMVNEFGLLQCQHLAGLFPNLNMEFVQQLLIGLEFCIPVDPSVLKMEVKALVQSGEASGWLFFPAFLPVNPPVLTSEGLPPKCAYYLCWQLKTSKKHLISARVLQTVILHLAAHFVSTQFNEEGVREHCCSVWQTGITWQTTHGIEVSIYIINNRVIRVVSANRTASAEKGCNYLAHIVSDILSTVHQLSPNLAAAAYIVHPETAALCKALADLTKRDVFLLEDIQESLKIDRKYALSPKDCHGISTQLPISDLFGKVTPPLQDIEKMMWRQCESSRPRSLSEQIEPNCALTNSRAISSLCTASSTSFTDPPPILAAASTNPPPSPTSSTNPASSPTSSTNLAPSLTSSTNLAPSLTSSIDPPTLTAASTDPPPNLTAESTGPPSTPTSVSTNISSPIKASSEPLPAPFPTKRNSTNSFTMQGEN